MKQWYVLYTKAHAEAPVAAALTGMGMEPFLPELRTFKSGRKVPKSEPLFPCYLFTFADLGQLSPAWQWTPGLRQMVQFAGEPAVVPERVIDAIKKEVAQQKEWTAAEEAPFRHGDIVRITQGPLADLLAVFDGLVDGNSRSQVLVDFLGRICRAKVDLQDLEQVRYSPNDDFSHPLRRTRGRGRPITPRSDDRNRRHNT